MDLRETNQLTFSDECNHWWIKTRFLYLNQSLQNLNSKNINVIEFGCGSGQNMWYLAPLNNIASIEGIDPNLPTDFIPAFKSPKVSFKKAPEMLNTDLMILMDVMEHLENDREIVKSWIDHLSKNGIIFVTVPAFMSLWSYHDQSLGHYRRYTKEQLILLFKELGFSPLKVNYGFSLFFPIVYLVRQMSKDQNKASIDLKKTNSILNYILYSIGKIEYFLGGNPWFGTSVIGTFKKN